MLGQENPTTPPASPAGAPVSASHRRLSRIARKHSNGSVQSSSSSGTAKSTENVGIRQPAKSKIRRHQHRLSAVFSRGARRLSGEMASSEEVKEDPSELSNHITAPGILKIFGTEICEGANYKSVLATTHSSAKELVKEALARYSLNKEDADHYVLCDVIGCIGDQPWRTECLRVVGDNEKPLLLQSLWKPREGYARRFEIQRKAMVDEKISRDKDTVTAGLNEQARKLQKTRSRGKSATLDMDVTEVTVDHRLFRSLSETDLKPGDDQSSYGYPSLESRKNVPILTEREEPDSGAYKVKHCAASERAESESSDDNSTQYSIHPPLEFPYFLLLQGFSFRQDFVIYPLTNNYTIFGRHVEDICNENEAEAEILRLWAPDILPQHCHIRRLDIGPGSAVGRRGCVTLLTPLNRAKVKRNGVSVHQEVDLQSGDIIGLGDYYLFMYKDPASPRVPANPALTLQWQDEMSLTYKLPPLCKTCVLSEKIRKPTGSLCFRDVEGHELVLVYDVEHETRVLKEIFATIEQYKEAHKLTPSFLLCLCIQQSATRFSMPALRRLLLQAANEVQMVVWEKAKELAALQPEFSQSDLDDPSSSTDMIIRVLEPLVLWMANSIQLLHFVHQEVPHLLHGISQEEEEEEEDCIAVLELRLSSVRSASEEAMTVLEEVLMFTFQQCVYYLTKILYPVLPGLLDNNPFSESGHLQVSESVKGVLDICTKTLHLVRGFQVHPQITLQLFAYLFFFINALLFNLLMERGSGGTFYHWSHGVQIRANLDQLMDWAHGAGLGDLAHSYLLKLSSAVNLLATPKENLSQMSWNSLRMEFASLNPAQLHHLLREYSPQRCRAAAWTPPSDEESAALRTADILESFDKHPPLILPVDGFLLALNNPFSESDLIDQLRHFQKRIRKLLYSESDSDTDISQLVSAVPVEAKLSKMEFDPSAQLATVSPHSGTSDLGACEALLTKKLQNLELQNKGVNHCSVERPMLDPSCLLTPPNTPQSQELTELDSSKSLGDLHEEDESKLGCETEEENVFVLELQRAESALGLVLMDGMATSTNGIIISSVIPDSPAALSQMIKPGDHILAVNGVSLVGMDFQTGKEVIQLSGDKPQLLITRTAIRKKQE